MNSESNESSFNEGEGPKDLGQGPLRWHYRLPVRFFFAFVGLLGVGFAEIVPTGALQTAFSDIGFAALFVAAVLLILSRRPRGFQESEPTQESGIVTWRWTILGLGFASAAVTQTWFRSGSIIAGGDIIPPIGTSGIGRIFSSFGWSGTNLGAPNTDQYELPFAIVKWVTHIFGGSGALAQRIWFTFLVVAIVMAAGALGRSLRFSPMACAVVAVAYFFSPMTLSQVNIYDNFLTAMALVPLLAAPVVSYGTGRIRLWLLCVIFIAAAPLVGYSSSNPPLVGMVTLTTIATPLLVLARFGRNAASRSVLGLLVAGPLLIGVSAYWLIPTLLNLGSVASGSLSAISAWAFTASRSTLTNALSLNTAWAWSYPASFPYAADFSHFPFVLVAPLIPLIPFSGLALRRASSTVGFNAARLRASLSIAVLIVVLLCTGIRSPGNIIFDPLYHLPYGWLLREPGRFLIVAALGYALLSGLLLQQIESSSLERFFTRRHVFGKRVWKISPSVFVGALIISVALAAGFPLWTGAVVPGSRQGFPSDHVVVPRYWNDTVRYLNSPTAPSGGLLVLPPDDFYQMPYTWYYGADGFIQDLLNRHVVLPTPQSYFTVSAELLKTVKLESTSILHRRWKEAGQLLVAIGTPNVLVRGDIEDDFMGRSIVSPTKLAAGFSKDPEMEAIFSDGKLSVYRLREDFRKSQTEFATVNTGAPNLSELAVLPSRSVLVTSKPQKGHASIFQLPRVSKWALGSKLLSTKLNLPTGWTYSVKSIDSELRSGTVVSITKVTNKSTEIVRVAMPIGHSIISDGTFSEGSWGAVGNCADFLPVTPPQFLGAKTIPHAGPGGTAALQLTASIDSACESKELSWTKGPIGINLWERTVKGSPARICLFEQPLDRCATLSSLPKGSGWHQYKSVVKPAAGTTSLSLYLYADSNYVGHLSKEEYARVSVQSLSNVSNLVLLGTPKENIASHHLITFETGYSQDWVGPHGAPHVVVDGLRNGWLVSLATDRVVPKNLVTSHEYIDEIFLATVMTLFAAAIFLGLRIRNRL